MGVDYIQALTTIGLAIAGTTTKSNILRCVQKCEQHDRKTKYKHGKPKSTALIVAPILRNDNSIRLGRLWIKVNTTFAIRLPSILQALGKHGKINRVVPCVGSNVKYVQYNNARSRKSVLAERYKVCENKYGAPAVFLVKRAAEKDAWTAVWGLAKPKNQLNKRSNSLVPSYVRSFVNSFTS